MISVSNNLRVQTISTDDFVAGRTTVLLFQAQNLGPSDTDPLTVDLTTSDFVSSEASYSLPNFDLFTVCGSEMCSLPALPAGESVRFAFQIDLDSSFALDTNTNLVYTVQLSDSNDPNSPHSFSSSETIQEISDLSLEKTSVLTSTAGDIITYTLEVFNDGPSDSPNAVVSNIFGNGVVLMSADAECALNGDSLDCSALRLVPGASQSFTYTVTADADSRNLVLNEASVTGPNSDPNPDNNHDFSVTNIIGLPVLALTVDDDVDPVPAGQIIQYSLDVSNSGLSDSFNALLAVQIPANSQLVQTTSDTQSVACSANDENDPTTVNCIIPVVAASTSETFSLAVRVAQEEQALTVQSVFTLSHSEIAADIVSVVETTIRPVSLSVTVTDSVDPIAPGQILELTVVLENTEVPSSDVTGVTVNFALPSSQINLISTISSSGQGICGQSSSGNSVLCIIPVIAAGSSEQLTLSFQVSLAEVTTLLIFDTWTNADGLLAPISVTETTTLDLINTLVLSVASTPAIVAAGSLATLTVDISNSASPNSDATNVQLLFDLPTSQVTFASFNSTAPFTACGLISGSLSSVACIVPLIADGDTETVTIDLFVESSEIGPNLDFSFDVTASELGISVNALHSISIQPTTFEATVDAIVIFFCLFGFFIIIFQLIQKSFSPGYYRSWQLVTIHYHFEQQQFYSNG